jgi:acyl-homoserine-lactone acylase
MTMAGIVAKGMGLLALGIIATGAQASPAGARPHRVTITRDTWGIAHVHGATDADAVYGMVYAQAQDDFNRVEVNYLTNLGRLAEAEGEKAIWQDLRQRLFIDPAQLKKDYAASPRWLRDIMDAWAAGLNAYLADHPQVKPRVLTHFEPWMALSFTEGSIGGDIEGIALSQLEAFYSKRKLAMTLEERGTVFREPQGSNGFAIAPSHSQSGHALLYINPHTSFYFRSELQMTSDQGLNAYGAVTWGQPFIYQGFNQHAGWMHTSSGIDNVDEYAESIVDGPQGKAYLYGGKTRSLTVKPITLSYRLPDGSLGRRRFETYATHHGPVIREEDGKWITIALMTKPVAALEQSFLRTKTHDLAGFLKVAQRKANSSNNTLFADDKGHIAYLHPQFVPIRDQRFDWRAPVDGSDPRTDWQGLHPLSSLPQVIDPQNGWAYNTNNAPWSAAGKDSPQKFAFPAYMDEVGPNPRGPHAERVLTATPRFTLDSLIAAGHDTWLPAFDRLLPRLFAADTAAPSPARAEAIALLKSWDHRTALTSTAETLAIVWGENLWAKGAESANKQRMTVWDWMDEQASNEQRLAALDEAMARLTKDFGTWRVAWGDLNRYQRISGAITQPFDDAKPSLPLAFTSSQWGALAVASGPRVAGMKRYYSHRGNSFVAAVEFGPRLKARAISTGGASGDPTSPHFTDQATRFLSGQLREVWFYPQDLKAHVESRLTLIRR